MINYIEKGRGLHEAIRTAGHWLEQRDGVWISSNDIVVQVIIDAFDPLPAARAAKWDEIKAERDRRQLSGVRVGEYRFHSDLASRTQYSILDAKAMRAGLPPEFELQANWKSMDRDASGNPVFVRMTVALLRQILDAGMTNESAVFAAAETHRIAMLASPNPDVYNCSGGWPEG